MGKLFGRLFAAIGRGLSKLFNVGIPLKFVLILLVLFTGGAVAYTSSTMIRNVGGKSDYDEAMRYIEIKDLLEQNYIDPVDRESMGDSAAAAMVAGLGDKWSSFMSADEYRTFQLSSSNEYSGIGISILKTDGGGFRVTSVNADSPAALAGLNAGMVIVSVDDRDVRGMDTDEVRTLIRSNLNKKFTLGIDGQSDPITIDCTRTYVNPVTYYVERTGTGYIKIANFEAGSGEAAIAAIEDLLSQNVRTFVLDIRDNPGGLVAEMTELLDYLLPQGDLFVSRDKSGNEQVVRSDNLSLRLPMCLLLNGQTFSEAEIFAAVIKEYQWATLIGEPTTGMTRTQQTIEISDGSAIRLSTHTYLTAGRVDISQSGGVVPDTIVYNTEVSETLEENNDGNGLANYASDAQLRTALTILSTGFTG